ncbi:MAG: glycerophosphodiester phosphodiesterase family protein [Bacteroidota bacterium]
MAQADGNSSKKRSPLIVGHRGGFYSEFPENSFAAIDYTFKHCDSSPVIAEIDIRKSREGTLFILHDESVDRTTGGHGNISELSDDYIKSLFLKNSKGELTTEKIPTFDSLLDYVRTRDVVLMLDIKADVWDVVIKRLVTEKLIHKAIVLTFKPSDSKRVYDLSRDIRISCLIRNVDDWNLIREQSMASDKLIAYINSSTPQGLINELKNNFMMVMTDVSESSMKNVNPLTREYYLEFIKMRKIDILITDFPADVSKKIR